MNPGVALVLLLIFSFLPDFCAVTVVYDPVDVDMFDAVDIDEDCVDGDDSIAGVWVMIV